MHEFDVPTKKTLINYIISSVGEYGLVHAEGIDSDVYKPLYTEANYSRKDIEELPAEHLDDALNKFYDAANFHLESLRKKTYLKHFQQGKEIHKVQKELGFAGELKMSLGKLCGYITAIGAWNEFYPNKVIPILHKMDDECPRMDYGVNNPKTGRKHHTWSIKSDYIFLNTEYIGGRERIDTWVSWMNEAIHKYRHGLNADSMRIDGEEYDQPVAAYKHLVMWWD